MPKVWRWVEKNIFPYRKLVKFEGGSPQISRILEGWWNGEAYVISNIGQISFPFQEFSKVFVKFALPLWKKPDEHLLHIYLSLDFCCGSRLIEEVSSDQLALRISIFVHVSCWFFRRFWSQKRRTQGEIQSEKQQSILPCVISDNAAAFLSVLHFLKPHRVTVERKRQDAHSIYMRPGKETVWLRQSDGRSNRARDDVFSYFWGGLFRDINKITAYLGNSTRQWILDTTHHWDRQNPNPKERWVQSSNSGKVSQSFSAISHHWWFQTCFCVHPDLTSNEWLEKQTPNLTSSQYQSECLSEQRSERNETIWNVWIWKPKNAT